MKGTKYRAAGGGANKKTKYRAVGGGVGKVISGSRAANEERKANKVGKMPESVMAKLMAPRAGAAAALGSISRGAKSVLTSKGKRRVSTKQLKALTKRKTKQTGKNMMMRASGGGMKNTKYKAKGGGLSKK